MAGAAAQRSSSASSSGTNRQQLTHEKKLAASAALDRRGKIYKVYLIYFLISTVFQNLGQWYIATQMYCKLNAVLSSFEHFFKGVVFEGL